MLRSFILIRVLYRESRLSYFENLTSSNISSLLDPRLLGPRRLENTKSTEHLPAPASVCLSTSRPSLRSVQPTRNRIPTHGSHQVQPIHRRAQAPPVLPHVVSHAFATGQHHRHSLHLEKSHFSLHLEKTFSFHFPPSPTCINPILDNTISIKSPRPRFFFSFQTRPGSTDPPIATRRDREIQSHDATAGTHAYPPQARAPVPHSPHLCPGVVRVRGNQQQFVLPDCGRYTRVESSSQELRRAEVAAHEPRRGFIDQRYILLFALLFCKYFFPLALLHTFPSTFFEH